MSIFSCVIDEVQNVVSQITQQSSQVEDVVNGIRGGMQPISGGAWVGQGAQAFIEEVNSRLIPQIMQLIASISGFGGGINSALDVMSQADNDVFGVVGNIGDMFDSIF
jgi:WXG100 family type VII secretion target